MEPIRLYDRSGGDRGDRQEAERTELAEARPGDEVHGEADRADDDRGPEVRLRDDQTGDETGEEQERQRHRDALHPLPMPTQPEREIEDEGELRELGRLDPDEGGDPKPPRCAADAGAEPGDEDRAEEQHRDDEGREREAAVAVIVDPRDDEHREQADSDPDRLLHEVEARLIEGVECFDTARAVDHEQADREEREHDRQEHEVIAGADRDPPHDGAAGVDGANSRTSARNCSPRSS